MKLIYSPYFGNRPYMDVKARGIVFDVKAVGTTGLLCELELRLGLTGTIHTETERLVEYVKAMRDAVACDGSLFFAESFRSDEIGTAKVLLGWRDALGMAMWDGNSRGSERLRGLSLLTVLAFGLAGSATALAADLLDVSYRPLAGKQQVNLEKRYHGQVLLVVIGAVDVQPAVVLYRGGVCAENVRQYGIGISDIL